MKRYKVTYIAKDDDCCSVWTSANNSQEAEQNIFREYWNIKEIIMCDEIK